MMLIAIIAVSSGCLVYGYYWISDWSKICTKDEMQFNATNLNNTPDLPANFYNVWDRLFPDSRNVSMLSQTASTFFHGLKLIKNVKDCKCYDIGYNSWNNHNFKWRFDFRELLNRAGYWRFGFGLSKYSSSEKCFDFWINNDFYYLLERRYFRNLNEFSVVLYDKDIQDLTDEQIVILIAYRLLETYPVYDESRFEKKKMELLEKLNQPVE